MEAMNASSKSDMTIGQLARRAGSDVETIRYYERRGLLPPPPRSGNGYRRYPPDAARRLRFIRRAKTLGFTLAEIGELLSLREAGNNRAAVKELARARLADLDARLADLQRMRDALADLDQRCTGHGTVSGCPIIEALDQETTA